MPVSPDYAMLHLKPLETIIKFQNHPAFSIVFAARMRNYAPAGQPVCVERFAIMPRRHAAVQNSFTRRPWNQVGRGSRCGKACNRPDASPST
ncbi:hypothetical protein [Aurantimonas sp. 22II-16-19i]|uniref:hypothetical protein n=1 Tax=Aurantimonas sp. 22II-16-19i TaxID=1317114 RepID=UPI00111C431B|nr:hypothetical protein [Aurantimonas sp. 22II-16-19i]